MIVVIEVHYRTSRCRDRYTSLGNRRSRCDACMCARKVSCLRVSSSTTTGASSDWRNSLTSTSCWRSSDSGFVIIHHYRGKSRSSVWQAAVAVCRQWSQSCSPWCHDGPVCRRQRACHWSSAMSFPWRSSQARARRSVPSTLSVVETLGCGGRIRHPLSPAIVLIIVM